MRSLLRSVVAGPRWPSSLGALWSQRARLSTHSQPEGFVGSASSNSKHLILSSGIDRWPSKVEDTNAYIGSLSSQLNLLKIKFSCSDARPAASPTSTAPPAEPAYALTLYPDQIYFPSVAQSQIPLLLQRLESGNPVQGLDEVSQRGKSIDLYVCTHGERDCRCGDLGRPLFTKLKQATATRADIRVFQISHIGGHKYAGNVIAFPSGDWYGNLTSEKADELLASLDSGRELWSHWRGRLGLSKEQQIELLRQSSDSSSAPSSSQEAQDAGSTDSIQVTFATGGKDKVFSVPLGMSLMEFAKSKEIPSIEGACGGNLECATCHVIVDPSFVSKIPPPSDSEEDMLEYAVGRAENSRLSCQIKANKDIDGIVFHVPSM
ncbi:Sucrase/ferredoxin-like-domain-containing protein [Polychytrium aggregatum]|uniref:Sucrase/ferredoxin-like-domain-containing protein n=1 Tax=Polychytrium aggregatum TaxID=110093 RepID=UPI0022FE6B49|nr:Sucrase/ferredoxin-like-domain-containing protein [Polychytrium aggregatum]XP_052970469.1 Sucrase/ferredoxin-like-domain-containing protein [Polychytrium aggregatum]KAI9199772.1 Sucrase/ferredoxin-like-domain-containing protein [Polychytrium aggregatum]KAI9208389.1 Sucrase/ferredoxin-like-domain-containing protein [Polychytrium aggregatum]